MVYVPVQKYGTFNTTVKDEHIRPLYRAIEFAVQVIPSSSTTTLDGYPRLSFPEFDFVHRAAERERSLQPLCLSEKLFAVNLTGPLETHGGRQGGFRFIRVRGDFPENTTD